MLPTSPTKRITVPVPSLLLVAITAALLFSAGCTTSGSTSRIDSGIPSLYKPDAVPVVYIPAEVPAPTPAKMTTASDPVVAEIAATVTPVVAVLDKEAPSFGNRLLTVRGSVSSLNETAELIAQALEIPVRITREAQAAVDRNQAQLPTSVDFSGSAATVLSRISGQYGVYWRSAGETIEFYLIDTRVFAVDVFGGTVGNTVGVSGQASTGSSGSGGNGGGGGGSSGGADQRTTFSNNTDFFPSIADAVKSMLSPSGKVAASHALGTITVTDTPDVLANVESFVSQTNKRLARPITFEVRIFSFENTTGTNYGIDFGVLANSISSNFGVRAIANSGVEALSNAFALTIPASATGVARKYSGSEIIARALATQGRVALRHSGTFSTMNGIAATFVNGSEIVYSARSGTVSNSTSNNNGNTAPAIEAASKEVGVSLNMYPVISSDNSVRMQWYLSITKLDELRRITQGAGTTSFVQEFPRISLTKMAHVSTLRNGQTLMIAGYEQAAETDNRQGPFVSSSLFGGESALTTKSNLVVTLTPVF